MMIKVWTIVCALCLLGAIVLGSIVLFVGAFASSVLLIGSILAANAADEEKNKTFGGFKWD